MSAAGGQHGTGQQPGGQHGTGQQPGGARGSEQPGLVRLGSGPGRWVILATVLGSGMALLDGSAVNVALPAIGRQLHTSLTGLQWIVSGYTLALAALILLGGSLGDRQGRRKVFLIGVAWFALASALCGVAPNIDVLIAARVLQGIGGALLVPGSLAIIQASFAPQDRPRAIGAWSGLGGLAAAAGPLLGGWFVVSIGWRWVFGINVPVAAVVLAIGMRHIPETRDDQATQRFDVLGAVLAAAGLAGISYALIGASASGTSGVALIAAGVAGLACGAAFVLVERARGRPGRPGRPSPMLPLGVFASRQFSVINIITFCVYAGFSGQLFLLVLELQSGAGFSALAAGTALLPVTVLLLVLSPRSAALAQRIGPRRPLTAGCLICGAGLLMLLRVGPHTSYLTDVLPAVAVFGLGLSLVVSPLTATVLASADVRHAGVASGVNNAVARAAGLIAVAGLPTAVGLTAADYHNPVMLTAGFRSAMIICAGLLVLSAALAVSLVDDRVLKAGQDDDRAKEMSELARMRTCPVESPGLYRSADSGQPRAS